MGIGLGMYVYFRHVWAYNMGTYTNGTLEAFKPYIYKNLTFHAFPLYRAHKEIALQYKNIRIDHAYIKILDKIENEAFSLPYA